ncbi:hypothetical protein J7L60_01865 [Candidatus Bathyarchaeota archaeon]|nr:hypothetical protein [Candidatus Bathyarchaeota archaeon]
MPPQIDWRWVEKYFHPAEIEIIRRDLEEGKLDEVERRIKARQGFVDGCRDVLGKTEEEIIDDIMWQGDLVEEGLSDDWLPPDEVEDLEEESP